MTSTKTTSELISLKEYVADLVAVVKSNQYHSNKRKNPQANKSAGAQIDQGLQSNEPPKLAVHKSQQVQVEGTKGLYNAGNAVAEDVPAL